MTALLIITGWFLCGYLGGRVLGLTSEYMDFYVEQSLFFMLCGILTLLVACIYRLVTE